MARRCDVPFRREAPRHRSIWFRPSLLVSAWCWDKSKVANKSNEIIAIPKLPDMLAIEGAIAAGMPADRFMAIGEKSWSREPSSMPRATAELRLGLPDDAVIVDESITASLDLAKSFDYRSFGDRVL